MTSSVNDNDFGRRAADLESGGSPSDAPVSPKAVADKHVHATVSSIMAAYGDVDPEEEGLEPIIAPGSTSADKRTHATGGHARGGRRGAGADKTSHATPHPDKRAHATR